MIKQTRIILNSIDVTDRVLQAGRRFGLLVLVTLLVACGTPTLAPPPAEPPVVQPPVKRPPKIGLALGGGAARGFAHVGVIQVLEEAGIRPDFVAGTSAGSLVATLYASGKTGAQLQVVALEMDEAAFADWTLPIFSRGMLRGEALARYVNAQVGQPVDREHGDSPGGGCHRPELRSGHPVSAAATPERRFGRPARCRPCSCP
jgi:NTE family protein